MDLIGQTILNRYQVLSMLGEGAMGAVYLADDVELKRQVALKVLRHELAARPDVVKRLANECQIMARLGPHGNIVTLYDRLVYEGDVILVMEFVPGESLSALIERTRMMNTSTEAAKKTVALDGGTLPVMKASDALALADQCLAGLDFAHSKGVLHRDIKPDNIMVTRDHTGRPQAKIMDFGIGKAISGGAEPGSPMLTMVGGPGPGTPAYMAPEQIDPQRFGPIGPAADLYAFGVTLYQMLTLNLPFDGTYTELLNAHTNVDPPDPTLRNPAITPAIRAVLVKALRKNQQERYNSAAEFRMDLAAAGSGGGTMIMSTATGGFGTAPTKTSPGIHTPVPTPPPVPAAPATARRSKWIMPGLVGVLLLGVVGFLLLRGDSSPAPTPPPIPTPIPTPTPTPTPIVSPEPTPIPSPTPTLTPTPTQPQPSGQTDSSNDIEGVRSKWRILQSDLDHGYQRDAADLETLISLAQKYQMTELAVMQEYRKRPKPNPTQTVAPSDPATEEARKDAAAQRRKFMAIGGIDRSKCQPFQEAEELMKTANENAGDANLADAKINYRKAEEKYKEAIKENDWSVN